MLEALRISTSHSFGSRREVVDGTTFQTVHLVAHDLTDMLAVLRLPLGLQCHSHNKESSLASDRENTDLGTAQQSIPAANSVFSPFWNSNLPASLPSRISTLALTYIFSWPPSAESIFVLSNSRCHMRPSVSCRVCKRRYILAVQAL
jgi:hypothetical protein